MDLEESKRAFYTRCLALNLSPETLKQYEKVLKRFSLFDKEVLKKGDTVKVTADDIRNHLNSLSATMKPVTQKIHYMSLKVFFNFLYREGLIRENPMSRIERPKIPQREVQSYNRQEVFKLINGFDKTSFIGYRNHTIMTIFFSTGMRRGELTRLLLSDIHFDVNIIQVIGKGNKQRSIPMSITLRRTLKEYIRKREEYIDRMSYYMNSYLLINCKGEPMSPMAVYDVFKVAADRQKITGVRVSPHTFRHTFAKYFLLNGGDIFSLQKILGHSDIAVTKKYVSLNDKEIRIQNDRYNPLDNLSWRYY